MSSRILTHENWETTARSENVPSMQKPPRSWPSSSWKRNVPSASMPVGISAPWWHRFCRAGGGYREGAPAGGAVPAGAGGGDEGAHHVVARGDAGDSLADGLDDARALVAAHHGQPG